MAKVTIEVTGKLHDKTIEMRCEGYGRSRHSHSMPFEGFIPQKFIDEIYKTLCARAEGGDDA